MLWDGAGLPARRASSMRTVFSALWQKPDMPGCGWLRYWPQLNGVVPLAIELWAAFGLDVNRGFPVPRALWTCPAAATE